MSPQLRLACALLCTAAAAGCASTEVAEGPPLPFHVAVIPFEAEDATALLAAGGEDAGERDIELDLGPYDVADAVTRALDGRCFTRATLLRAPEGAANLSPEERNLLWADAAARAGADLLLDCELQFRQGIHGERNDKFWLNLPLFLFASPTNYFVDDRTYSASAELLASLYDLSAIHDGRAALDSGASRVLSFSLEAAPVTMDFLDRAGTAPLHFATSLVIPAGFLATETSAVKRRLEEDVVQGLADDLARRIRGRSDEVVEARGLVPFFLDPGRTRLARGPDGALQLEGEVVLFQGRGARRMDRYSIAFGGEQHSFDFAPGERDPALSAGGLHAYRYALGASLTLPAGVDAVQLEIVDGSRNRNSRTYTFAIGEGAAAAPVELVARR